MVALCSFERAHPHAGAQGVKAISVLYFNSALALPMALGAAAAFGEIGPDLWNYQYWGDMVRGRGRRGTGCGRGAVPTDENQV